MVDAAQQRVIILLGQRIGIPLAGGASLYKVIASHPEIFDLASLGDKIQSDWLAAFQPSRMNLVSERGRQLLQSQTSQEWG